MRTQRLTGGPPPHNPGENELSAAVRPGAYDPAVLVQALPTDVLRQLIGAAAWPPDEANAVVEMTGPGTRALLLTFDVVERYRRADGSWSVRLTEQGYAFLAALNDGTLLPSPVRPVAAHGRVRAVGRVLPARRPAGAAAPPPFTGYYEVWPSGADPGKDPAGATVTVVRHGDVLQLWQAEGAGPALVTADGRELPKVGQEPIELDTGGTPPPSALRDLLAFA